MTKPQLSENARSCLLHLRYSSFCAEYLILSQKVHQMLLVSRRYLDRFFASPDRYLCYHFDFTNMLIVVTSYWKGQDVIFASGR